MGHGTRQRRKRGAEVAKSSRANTNDSDDSRRNLCLILSALVVVIGVGVALAFATLSYNEQHAPEETAPPTGDSDAIPDLLSSDQQSDVDKKSVDVVEADEWDWEVKRPSKALLSPEWMESLISSLEIDGKEEGVGEKVKPIDRDGTIREARRNVKEKKWMEAKRLYRHVLHYNPWDNQAMKELHYIYYQEYPEGPNGQTTFNFTKHLFKSVKQRLKQKSFDLDGRPVTIRQLHPSIFAFHNFLSDEECDYLIQLHNDSLHNASLSPLMCFQHEDFMAKELIRSNLIKGTYCLRQPLSVKVAPHLTWSYSTSHYRGEDAVVDRIERRIEELGLRHRHARDLQLLSYEEGVSYNDHTDCFYKNKVTDQDKAATFLAYLQDENLEGGETAFPRLGISIKPKRGMAVIFYNFNGQTCNLDMMHRSTAVKKGKKLIAQKWYSYPDAPFYNERPYPARVHGRLPYQPVVSCDYILAGGESSCRWYEHWPFAHTKE